MRKHIYLTATFTLLVTAILSGCGKNDGYSIPFKYGGGVLTSESFNRTNTTTLAGGSTDAANGGLPLPYLSLQGLALSMGILSNQAYATTGSLSADLIDTGYANCAVQITMSTLPSVQAGILFRVQDSTNNWLLSANSNTGYFLIKTANGAITTVLSPVGTPKAGDLLRAEFSGSTITVKVNGTTVGTTTDSTFANKTGAGFLSYDTTARLDNFLVENCN